VPEQGTRDAVLEHRAEFDRVLDHVRRLAGVRKDQ
jgi:hypothetical protein